MQALSTSTQTPFAAGSAIRRLIGLGQARGGTLIWIASSKWIGANPWSCGERNIVEDKLTEWVIDRCCPVAYPCHPTEWIDDSSEESEEESSGYYDEHWAVNKPTTRYYYDGQMGFEDDYTTNPGGGPQVTITRYALGARGIDAIETTLPNASEVAVYPVYDGHGNMIATLARASAGMSFTRQHDREYDAWGNLLSGSGGDQGYVANLGHRKDVESGLTYMRARYYESGTGRFISEDPSFDGLNWYVYCGNQPITNHDPTGRFTLGDYEFRIDWNLDSELGDIHVWQRGREVISMWGNGTPHHRVRNEWTRDIIQTIVRAARAGDMNARHLLNALKEGWFGAIPEVIDDFIRRGGGLAVFAITSVEAYAQINPADFADLMNILSWN